MPPYADLADLPEDERIKIIGKTAMSFPVGKRLGIVVDAEKDKVDRYVRKISTAYPLLRVSGPEDGPVANVVMLFVERKE